MLILAELIACSTRRSACILSKWFLPNVMSLSLIYGSPEAPCNKQADTYFGKRSASLIKEFWTICILLMKDSETVRVEAIPYSNIGHILTALQQNGYPRDFIMKTIKQHKRRKERTTEVTEEEFKPNKKINLPYIQGASEQLRRTFNKYSIRTTFYTPTTLRRLLSKPKDPIPKEDRNNVIYQLDCKNCETVYAGETKRTLNINEHISAVKSTSQRSHTAEHCWKYNHDFDWNNTRVLDLEKNWKTRTSKEAIYSEENKHHINGISYKLPTIWKPILQKNREEKTTTEIRPSKTHRHQTRVLIRPQRKPTNQQ